MFESEYVRLVIKPKIDGILEDGVESIKDLTAQFNQAFDCKVSKSRITEWLKLLDYRITRTVQIARPQAPQVSAPPRVRPEYDSVPSGPAPQFNYPAPSSVFSNVRMPGFEE